MPLNCEISSATADSMITLDEMLSFIELFYTQEEVAEWNNLPLDLQEEMLRYGAMMFDYVPLRGDVAVAGQSMPFPRTCQADTTIIPQEIKQAQADMVMNVVVRTYISRSSATAGATSDAQVKSIDFGGLLQIDFSGQADTTGSVLEQFSRGVNAFTWLKMNKYIARVRGALI